MQVGKPHRCFKGTDVLLGRKLFLAALNLTFGGPHQYLVNLSVRATIY